MCLALPGEIVSVDGIRAIVRHGKVERSVLNAAGAVPGEWVLVQQGIASEKLDSAEKKIRVAAWNRAVRKKKKTD